MPNLSSFKPFNDLVSRLFIDIRDVERIGAFHFGPGADLRRAVSRFVYWLLTDPEGVRRYATPEVLKAFDAVAGLYARVLSGEVIPDVDWQLAARHAEAAMHTIPEEMGAAFEAGVAVEAAVEPDGALAWMVAFSAFEAPACAIDDGKEETQPAVAKAFQTARNRVAVKLLEIIKEEAVA